MNDISLHILDIFQNSIKAQCERIELEVHVEGELLEIAINDDGDGMDEALLKVVESPFVTSRKERAIGLGIPLLKDAALFCGGYFDIKSKKGTGTMVKAGFNFKHIDMPPLGDLADTIGLSISSFPNIRFIIHLKNLDKEASLDTDEIKQVLGGLPLNDLNVVAWIREYLDENINFVFGGVFE